MNAPEDIKFFHRNTPKLDEAEVREAAVRMACNILMYTLTHP